MPSCCASAEEVGLGVWNAVNSCHGRCFNSSVCDPVHNEQVPGEPALIYIYIYTHEGQLISNALSEISRKRDHVFKQTKVGGKVQYFSYKLTYLFFDIVTLSFNTFFPT
jgi:hypothetical protein